MKRLLVQVRKFTYTLDTLIENNKLSRADYDDFEKRIVANPEEGDVIPGTGGLRKTRIKSSSKGKSGGFRICYLDCKESEKIFLLLIYGKGEMDNISQKEKVILKHLVEIIKNEESHGKVF